MSINRRILKVISIISLVIDIIIVGCGVFLMVACFSTPDAALDAASQNLIAGYSAADALYILIGAAVITIIFGAWDLFVSIMGIRGANNPSKMGFVTVCAGISFVLSIIGVIGNIVTVGFDISGLFTLGFMGIFFDICRSVRNEGKQLAQQEKQEA